MLLSIQATAQTPCSTCEGHGLVPCRVCSPCEAEVGACSTAAICRRCGGALAELCPDCDPSTTAEDLLRRRRALAQDYLAECRAISTDHGLRERGTQFCRTEHFDLLCATGRIDGCPESDPHLQLHLFARRLESLRQRFVALLGVDDPPSSRIRIAVVKDESDLRRLCHGLLGLEVQGLGGLSAEDPPTAVLLQARDVTSDAALHRMVVHATAHLLSASLPTRGSLDGLGWGWLDAGLAHWFENDRVGSCDNFCILSRPQSPRQFWGGDWKTGVRELLDIQRLPELVDLVAMETSDMDLSEHALAYAFFDFLQVRAPAPVTHGDAPPPPPVTELLRAAKRGEPAATALPRVLGMDLAAIATAFHEFVRATYPRR